MSLIRQLLNSSYCRFTIFSVIGAVGIVGGIVFGQFLTGPNSILFNNEQDHSTHNQEGAQVDNSVALSSGDMFPGEPFTLSDGTHVCYMTHTMYN